MKKTLLALTFLIIVSGTVKSQEQWTLLSTSNSEIPSDRLISLGLTTDDDVYIGVPGGLIDPSHVYNYNGSDWVEMDWFSEFNGMKSSPDGHLAIATGEGVYHYDGTDYVIFNEDNSNLTANNVSCMDIGSDGTEYIGMTAAGLLASGGLGIYNGTFWAVYNTDNSPLPVDNVISVFASQSGLLWIGSQDAGLVKKDGDNWEVYTTDNSEIPDNRPIHMAETSTGLLWIAFNNGSLATFDGTNWVIENDPLKKNLPDSNISDMLIDSNDEVWVGFEDAGIGRYDGENWVFYTSLTSPLPNDNISGLEIDSKGHIWMSTIWEGIAIFDPDFGSDINDLYTKVDIEIYPNPVSTSLTLNVKELKGIVELYIYNSLGELVIRQYIDENIYQINCNQLQTGFYTLRLIGKDSVFYRSKSFIKK